MKLRSRDFLVEEGQHVNLTKWPTAVEPTFESKKQYQKILANHVDQLAKASPLISLAGWRVQLAETKIMLAARDQGSRG